jgi:hypothetical protein
LLEFADLTVRVEPVEPISLPFFTTLPIIGLQVVPKNNKKANNNYIKPHGISI